jgi:alkanesulfonate monooxygenase SsuD/methylene tetrahydromethanopterin reductase-like flavin-dependent oxidoreductase (luciferase family)
VSQPHPVIWVGGESPPALRRVARFGNAWYPVSNNQQFRLNTPERLRAGVDNMRRVVEKTGRDPGSVDVGYLWFKSPSETVQKEPDGSRQLFTGSSADWQEDAAALREAGAQHVILYIQRPAMNEMLELMQRVSEAVQVS